MTDHLANESSHLTFLRSLKEPFVVEVAKEDVSLIGKSIGELIGLPNQNVRFCKKNVIFVSKLRENLLSEKKLSQVRIDVLFTSQGGAKHAEFKLSGEIT